MAATTHEHDAQPTPGGVRRKPILAWTILAVLVVVGLIVVAATRCSGPDGDSASPGTSASSTAPVIPGSGLGPCGLPGSAFAVPTTDSNGKRLEVPVDPAGVACPQSDHQTVAALPGDGRITPPADLIWQQIGGTALPFSSDAGPTQIEGGVPSGFAHTPQGALLSAVQYVGLMFAAVPAEVHIAATRERLVTTPENLERILTGYEAAGGTEQDLPADLRRAFGQIAGVRITSYSLDFAHVEWIRLMNGTFVTGAADMVWSDSDWKISAPPGAADPAGNARMLTSMDLSWSPWQ